MNDSALINENPFYTSVELTKRGPVLKNHPLPVINELTPALVVKPKLVGICRSDLKEVLGTRPIRSDFGHEMVGTVEWAGDSIQRSQGDIVCFDPHIPIVRTSGFANLVMAKGNPPDIHHAFPKIDKKIPIERLVFCEPMACAQHCISNLLRFSGRQRLEEVRVAIVGAGISGTLIGLLAQYYGAAITLFNRNIPRLEFIKQKRIFAKSALKLINKNITGQFDVIIPTASFLYPEILSFSSQIVCPGGLILLYGGTKAGDLFYKTNLNIDRLRRKEKHVEVFCQGKLFSVAGTHGASPRDFSTVIELLYNFPGSFPVEKLINEVVSLKQLPEKLRQLSQSDYYGKVVVKID